MPSTPAAIAKRRRASHAPDAVAPDAARALLDAEAYLWSQQRDDALWCGDIEAGPSVTALYVIFTDLLAVPVSAAARASCAAYLVRRQRQDGAWPSERGTTYDLCASAAVLLALRLLGLAPDAPPCVAARAFIRDAGGLERLDAVGRALFAIYGLVPWDAAPVVPIERTLLSTVPGPKRVRGLWTAWSIIGHHQPLMALPNGRLRRNPWLDDLWCTPRPDVSPVPARAVSAPGAWLRAVALRRATRDLLAQQSAQGLWPGGAVPTMVSLFALALQGLDAQSAPGHAGHVALARLVWTQGGTMHLQPARTPVRDTTLALTALGADKPSQARVRPALDALIDRQRVDPRMLQLLRRARAEDGEHCPWRVRWSRRLQAAGARLLQGRQRCLQRDRAWRRAAGWAAASQAVLPDPDTTAGVLLAACAHDPRSSVTMALRRAVWWLVSAGEKSGGWSEAGTARHARNPLRRSRDRAQRATPHVTAHVLEALAVWKRCVPLAASHADPALAHLRRHVRAACRRGVRWLRAQQDAHGSWSAGSPRLHLRPTARALRALQQAGVVRGDTMVEAAVRWVRDNQNSDGGWSDTSPALAPRRLPGEQPSACVATARAVLGLLAYLPAEDPAIVRGIGWLVQRQVAPGRARPHDADGALPLARGKTWRDEGPGDIGPTGLPERARLLQHCVPMLALARYTAARDACE